MTGTVLNISDVRGDLCRLVSQVQTTGEQIILTRHGQRAAILSPYREKRKPWRRQADPKRFGNLEAPVMEGWQ